MIVGVHHVQISVPVGAEQEARAFYCGVLGIPEIKKPESLQARGGFWLSGNTVEVHVGVEDGIDRAATRAHVAWQVRDLPAWRERLQSLGIATVDGVPIPGYARFEFRDPFGNRVEFIEALPLNSDPASPDA
jgi:catechol 2,3-dioxygenase-like lactoylglutathione lyase family enzyme